SAEEFKKKGNAALTAGNNEEAINFYTEGIKLDETNHLLYSNRSAAYAKVKKYEESLKDAEKVIKLRPDWGKGYSRKGAALIYLERYQDAKSCYEFGLTKDSQNEGLKAGLKDAIKCMSGDEEMPNPFMHYEEMVYKLQHNDKTKPYFDDPSYEKMLYQLSQNPSTLTKQIRDPRMQNTLSALLGFDLTMPAGNGDVPMETDEVPNPATASAPSPAAAPASAKPATPPPAENTQPANIQDFNNEFWQRKSSLKEKELGNSAYKKKDFEAALEHYDKAFSLDPLNITILTNKAAVYFELSDFEKCREACHKAIEVGRENRIDYKLVAKAFCRIGNSYMKEKNYKSAVQFYNKSLTEHRTKDVLSKLQQCEKAIAEQERLAFINPELSLQEKEKGNAFFKEGKFPEALKCYTEAIKRNPEDAKLYSNRAACYMKLAEFQLALKDCDACIAKDPKFIKAHIRKGAALEAMKENSRALDAYQKAMDIDPNNAEASDGCRRCLHSDYQTRNDPKEVEKRVRNDPEVGRIMSDPAMKMILEQIQRDPKALQEHMKNPQVARNIQKLLDVGILSVR
uniref:Stress-induced-phosphoprotein 1 n=1 Tax=Ciona savignyi TaxID=51511 RepID=H2YCX0_CIOSA